MFGILGSENICEYLLEKHRICKQYNGYLPFPLLKDMSCLISQLRSWPLDDINGNLVYVVVFWGVMKANVKCKSHHKPIGN